MYYTLFLIMILIMSTDRLSMLIELLAAELRLTPTRSAGRSTLVRLLAELRRELRRRRSLSQPLLF